MSSVNIINKFQYDLIAACLDYGAFPSDPFKTYLILTNGLTITESTTLADIVAAELPQGNGYSRQNVKVGNPLNIASISSNVITTKTPHVYSAGDPVYLFRWMANSNLNLMPTSMPQVQTGVPYYVINPAMPAAGFANATSSLQISASMGGTPITFSNSNYSDLYIASAGSYQVGSKSYRSFATSILMTAGNNNNIGLNYDTSVILKGASSWSNQIVTANPVTDIFTTAGPHGLQVNDMVVFSAGGLLPATSDPTTSLSLNRVFRVYNPTTNTFGITTDGTTVVNLTTTGSGVILVRNANGQWSAATLEDSNPVNLPINIPANRTRQFVVSESIQSI